MALTAEQVDELLDRAAAAPDEVAAMQLLLDAGMDRDMARERAWRLHRRRRAENASERSASNPAGA